MRVHFFDPHPGFLGAVVPLPDSVLAAVRRLDGTDGELAEALAALLAASVGAMPGAVAMVDEHGDFIAVSFVFPTGPKHSYRAIRYAAVA